MATTNTALLSAVTIAATAGFSNHAKLQLSTSQTIALQLACTSGATAPYSATNNPLVIVQYISRSDDVTASTAFDNYAGNIYSFSCKMNELAALATETFTSQTATLEHAYLYIRISVPTTLEAAITATLTVAQHYEILNESTTTTITHSASGALTIDCNNDDYKVTAAATITGFTLTNRPPAGKKKYIAIEAINWASQTITYTADSTAILFPNDVTPNLTASGTDILLLIVTATTATLVASVINVS